MKKIIIESCLAAVSLGMAGCASLELFDPSDTTRNTVRSASTVSHAEYVQAARAAAQDALSSPTLTRFLRKYNQTHGKDDIPIIQIAEIVNDTDDPDLNQKLITDEIGRALLNSGLMEVTMAAGADVRSTFADARDLKHDKNFNQTTIAKKGTLEAPSLSLEGAIISNKVKDGRKTVVVRSFNLKIADIETGKVIWTYNKSLGFGKTEGAIGW
ncbi:MAG: hypothetical protein PHV82_04270 [Victivallaceae bacterium]|nr:hypothetical protein [Victivallaceae bacterium]